MSKAYRYGRRSIRHRHIWPIVIAVVVFVVGPIVGAVYVDLHKHSDTSVSGAESVVGQVGGIGDDAVKKINEDVFTLSLPSDWKEVNRVTVPTERSITWEATKKNHDGRWIKIYIDTIPATYPVNRLLPVTPRGDKMVVGDISDNCATFTGGGTMDASKATQLSPALAKWQGVDFMCNLPNVVDNQVGISAVGPINTIALTGAQKGAHKFFMVYTDHTVQPDYMIATNIIESFQVR